MRSGSGGASAGRAGAAALVLLADGMGGSEAGEVAAAGLLGTALGLVKQIAHARGADADKHFHKIRT